MPLTGASEMLRDLLPFSQPQAKFKASGSARALLEGLAALPPLEAVSRLIAQVLPAIAVEGNLHMRFKLLEEALPEAERALPALEDKVAHAELPFSMSTNTAAVHADNLLKAMANAYAGLARKIDKSPMHTGLETIFNRSIQRAVNLLARRQFLAYTAYATPSASSWLLLHELYQMACAPGTKALDEETGPIELDYLGALIFAYLDPSKLPHAELGMIHRCTTQLAPYATLGEASATAQNTGTESCFVVRPSDGNPGYPLTRLPSGTSISGGLIIDCTQILAALDRNIARLPGKAVQPDLEAAPPLLQNMRVALGGKSARRFSRTRFRPRADLIAGLDAVLCFIDGHAFSRRSLDEIGGNDPRNRQSSEWSLVDESPDGFRVRFIKGETIKLSAGNVVALQPRESSKVHICLVRRVSSTAARLEMGLQLLSPQISAIQVKHQNLAAIPAIFLHSLPAYGRFSGVIVAPGKFKTGQKISFDSLGRSVQRQIGKCIEANEGLEFFALDPLPN